jgi:hypothetical protein
MGEQELNEWMDFDHNLQVTSALTLEERPNLSPTICQILRTAHEGGGATDCDCNLLHSIGAK